MIFGSLFLLLVSAVLLAFGIGKSTPSLLLLVLALISAVLASLLLLAAYQANKVRLALAGGGNAGGSGTGAGAAPTAMPAFAGGAGGAVYYVPVAASGQPLMFAVPPANGHATEPLIGYDGMTSAQVVKLIGSGALTEDQKMAIVAYETGHQQRKTVIAALNAQAE